MHSRYESETHQTTYLANFGRNLFFWVRDVPLGVAHGVARGSLGAGDEVGLTAHLPLPPDRVRLFRDVLAPKGDALVHVLLGDCSSLEVGLQGYAACKGNLVRVGQSCVRERAKRYRTQPVRRCCVREYPPYHWRTKSEALVDWEHTDAPFVAPTTATVGEHAIPDRAVALAPVPDDGPSVDRPRATQVRDRPAVLDRKSKRASIEVIRLNLVRIPGAAAKTEKNRAKREFS
jgi:hypothetical protein